MKKFLLLAAIAAVIATPAHATSGNTSQAVGAAAANIVTPIVLIHVSGATLNFGSFTTGSGGAVDVTAAGVGSTSGDVGFVPGTLETADKFNVTGGVTRSFAISTTGGSVANGTTTIAFSTAPSAVSGITGTNGTASFTVGGTLTVLGSEGAGAYTGTYNATVTYN